MADLKEQFGCFRFYFKLARNDVEIFWMLKIIFWSAENKNVIVGWLSQLRSGEISIRNVDQMQKPVLENSRIALCEGANMLGLASGSVQNIWMTI
jgi:hypothetical protein